MIICYNQLIWRKLQGETIMKTLLTSATFFLLIIGNVSAAPISTDQKIKATFNEITHSIHHDNESTKKAILHNALATLSGEAEIEHETEMVIEALEKKFPNKTKQQLIALLSATLLSETH